MVAMGRLPQGFTPQTYNQASTLRSLQASIVTSVSSLRDKLWTVAPSRCKLQLQSVYWPLSVLLFITYFRRLLLWKLFNSAPKKSKSRRSFSAITAIACASPATRAGWSIKAASTSWRTPKQKISNLQFLIFIQSAIRQDGNTLKIDYWGLNENWCL